MLATGQIWHSYDFPTHVFFATHYQRDWWSLWEPRWFEGFDVASYPPLTHQLAAFLGWLVGDGNAVNLLTGATVLLFPVGIYRLAGTVFGALAARRAATLAVVTPSVLLAGYAFGQLPTLFALDASLFAAAELREYLRRGGRLRLALVLALAGVVVASHHATAVFYLPPLLMTIGALDLLECRRLSRQLVERGVVAAVGAGAVVLLVILPFWIWHAFEYVTQVPIDHQTRHNLLDDVIAQDLFFWAEHGVLIVGLVAAAPLLRHAPRSVGPWHALAVLLLVLGLGGTTPLPRLLFGSQWEWLTYDRFSLWSDVPLVLLLGAAAARLLDESKVHRPWARVAWNLTVGLSGAYALLGAVTPALVQTEPPPIDPAPIVAFLRQDGHTQWRYLTLGFGDQNGILNAETTAGTIDGAFFTARTLPPLTQSAIGQIDYSLFWDPNARLLRQFLADPAPHALRWVFTRDAQYEQILAHYRWSPRQTLSNGVQVWEAIDAIPAVNSPVPPNALLGIWWGTIPLASLAGALVGGWLVWRRDKDHRVPTNEGTTLTLAPSQRGREQNVGGRRTTPLAEQREAQFGLSPLGEAGRRPSEGTRRAQLGSLADGRRDAPE
jgi:hypothetical protein